MKRTLKIIGILVLILILFRGLIFRVLVKYNEIGTRTEIQITNNDLLEKIKAKSANKAIGIEEIVEIAMEITNAELKFTINRASNNPNDLVAINKANCIGYSAMFNSIANHLIRQNKLEGEIVAIHKVGQLDFLGIDIHQFFENPFYKDHDFNDVINRETGEVISIDPSVSDCLWIDRVAKR